VTEAGDYEFTVPRNQDSGRSIPVFSTAGVAFADARNSMSRLDASGFLAPFTIAAANTWANRGSAGSLTDAAWNCIASFFTTSTPAARTDTRTAHVERLFARRDA
jgi:hypothetical protein